MYDNMSIEECRLKTGDWRSMLLLYMVSGLFTDWKENIFSGIKKNLGFSFHSDSLKCDFYQSLGKNSHIFFSGNSVLSA